MLLLDYSIPTILNNTISILITVRTIELFKNAKNHKMINFKDKTNKTGE